jgi:hypothetical protein
VIKMKRTSKFRLVKALERGESGAFGDTLYLPFLFTLVVFGIFVAMLGFYRQMTVLSNERGASLATRASTSGSAQGTALSWFRNLTASGQGSAGSATSDQAGRSVNNTLNASTAIEMPFFGGVQGDAMASSQKRWEQFYAGPADCAGTTADSCEE